MPKLSDVERIIAKNSDSWLTVMESQGFSSQEVSLYRVVKGDYTTVYGRESGEEGTHLIDKIQCILVGDDFFPSDSYSSGTFQEGWLFSTSDKVQVGDLIEVSREMNTGTRRYNVIALHKLGTTKSVFRKFRLSAVGD